MSRHSWIAWTLATLSMPTTLLAAEAPTSAEAASPRRSVQPTCCRPDAAAAIRGTASLASWLFTEAELGITGLPAKAAAAAASSDAEEVPPLPPPLVFETARLLRPEAEQVDAVLQRWAIASQSLEPMEGVRRRRLQREWTATHGCSGHETATLAWLQGPLSERELSQLMTWTMVRSTDETVRLCGVPNDSTERLFIGRVEVTLDRETGLPAEARFFDRNGVSRHDSVGMTAMRAAIPVEPGRFVVAEATALPLPTAEAATVVFRVEPGVRQVGFDDTDADPDAAAIALLGIEQPASAPSTIGEYGLNLVSRWLSTLANGLRHTASRWMDGDADDLARPVPLPATER